MIELGDDLIFERVVAVTDVTTELIKGFENFEEYYQLESTNLDCKREL